MCCPVAHYDSGIRSSSDKSIRYDDMAENKLLSIGQGGIGYNSSRRGTYSLVRNKRTWLKGTFSHNVLSVNGCQKN